MMSLTDELMEDIHRRAGHAAAVIADELRDRVREAVSVDVEYYGGIVIRSRPGEPPRRETGDYSNSILSASGEDGDEIWGSAYTDHWKGHLEDGFQNIAPRPHWSFVYAEYSPLLMMRFNQLFSE